MTQWGLTKTEFEEDIRDISKRHTYIYSYSSYVTSSLNVNVTVNMLKWFSLTAQLVRGVSMGTQRWSCDGRIPNVTLHLDKLIKF